MADEEDRGALTTSDYAVMVEGLHRNQDPDDGADGTPGLTSRLLGDLRNLGFDADDIDHVEVARACSREAQVLRRLAALRVQRMELQAKRKAAEQLLRPTPRSPAGSPQGTRRTSLLASLSEASAAAGEAGIASALRRVVLALRQQRNRHTEARLERAIQRTGAELQALLDAPQLSTGHALSSSATSGGATSCCATFTAPRGSTSPSRACWASSRRRAASAPRRCASAPPDALAGVRVSTANEPSDILWENPSVPVWRRSAYVLCNRLALAGVSARR